MRMPSVSSIGILLAWVMSLPLAAAAPATPDFSREVRPLLSRHCFKCHGPDDTTRKAGLRLDDRESALKPAKSGARAVVPGAAADSELWKRIQTADPDEVMPPPSTKTALTAAEKDLLKRWIAGGAPYKPHWAFVPPVQTPLPKVRDAGWPRNPIDVLVLAELERQHLTPSARADRYTLIRRVCLDLTGLPPTPEEADAFVRDTSASAYESLVDRLLSSPRYGERWTRRWLDLARYADTNGYEKDRQRSAWPWRDWVLDALNADMPFDQFTLEQIAGDLIPNATRDQIVATGFHRNTMLNEEGGIDPLEFRYHAMTDRVNTTGTTWLGLTLGCAQCHTHKYDPIPQREYYQLMAFLNNADELDLDLPAGDAEARRKATLDKASALLAGLVETHGRPTDRSAAQAGGAGNANPRFEAWLTEQRTSAPRWVTLRPTSAQSNLPLLTVQPDDSVFASGDITKSDAYELTYRAVPAGTTALRLEVLPDDRLPRHGPGMTYYEGPKGDFFMGEFQVSSDSGPLRFASATETYAKNAFGSQASAALALDGDPQTGWSTSGREGERNEAVFVLDAPLSHTTDLRVRMLFGRHYACSLGRFRISFTSASKGVVARDQPEEVSRLLTQPEGELTSTGRRVLLEHFLLSLPENASTRDEIARLRKPPVHPTTLVFRERPPENPRPTFIHRRGEYLQPTERVEPGAISAIAALPPEFPRNRIGLARWLTSTNNPLTARVTVNRQWQAFFGRGLVRTVEDFGFQGEAPTHPDLIDWLAVEFMRQGWSLKRLHKLIVSSATYQQSSKPTPELLAMDPENRSLARGPRGRLEAEVIRDAVLQASGLLSSKMRGPSVYPPQPVGVTEITFGSPSWPASSGEDRHRRSLYTFMKRTAPFAMFNTFDAPTGESCLARRDVSNTPLQALTLLNDVFFVEVSQALGRTLSNETGTVDERLNRVFRRFLTRPAKPAEIDVLKTFYEAQRRRLSTGELDPKSIASEGVGEAQERAAWTAVARALINLDETISKN